MLLKMDNYIIMMNYFQLQKKKEIIENHIIERKNLINNVVYNLRGIYIFELSSIMKIKE